jgi:hypothetical protein
MTMDEFRTLSALEAADLLGLAPSTIAKLRLSGLGPAYLKLGRRVRYRVADLEAYMQANRRHSTSEDAAK